MRYLIIWCAILWGFGSALETLSLEPFQAKLVWYGEPKFFKLLPKVSKIYINDSPLDPGLVYDSEISSLKTRSQALVLIQMMRATNNISRESITICLDKTTNQLDYVLRVRSIGK